MNRVKVKVHVKIKDVSNETGSISLSQKKVQVQVVQQEIYFQEIKSKHKSKSQICAYLLGDPFPEQETHLKVTIKEILKTHALLRQ